MKESKEKRFAGCPQVSFEMNRNAWLIEEFMITMAVI